MMRAATKACWSNESAQIPVITPSALKMMPVRMSTASARNQFSTPSTNGRATAPTSAALIQPR